MPKLSEVMAQKPKKLSEIVAPAGPDRVSELSLGDLVTGRRPAPDAYNPTDDMGIGERLLVGYGSGVNQLKRGATQLGAMAIDQLPGVDLTDYRARLRQDVADDRAADAPLLDTWSGKIGNFLGQAVTTAPVGGVMGVGAKGATLGGAVLRGAATGAIEGAAQPVVEESERIGNVGLGAGLGGALPAAGRGVMRLGEELLPANMVSRGLNYFGNKANQTPFAAEGEALAARTGIDLTPGMVSGSRAQTGAENMARQSVFSADKAFEADSKVADQAINYVTSVMNRISRDSLSPDGIGEGVQRTVREGVEKIASTREATAARQYGAIRSIVGDKPVVAYSNTEKTLRDILGEYGDVIGGDAARIRAQAEKLLSEIKAKPEGVSLDAARRARSFYGAAARGKSNIFDDVAPDLNRRLASRMYGAMSSDLDAAGAKLDEMAGFGANMPTVPGQTVMRPSEMLRQANDDYRRFSQLLEGVRLSPLKRLLGDQIDVEDFFSGNTLAPEKVIERIGSMKPTEIRLVRDFMDTNAPHVWSAYKRSILEDALNKASVAPASAGANTLPLNAGAFIRALGGDKPEKIERLREIFKPSEMSEITDALQATRRMGDKFGANFSGTGPYNEVVTAIRNATVRGVASTASTAAGFNRVAQAMLDSDGRRALLTLAKVPPGSKRANDALAYLATSMAVTTEGKDPLEIDIVGGNPTADEQAQAEQERQQREEWLREQKAAGKL